MSYLPPRIMHGVLSVDCYTEMNIKIQVASDPWMLGLVQVVKYCIGMVPTLFILMALLLLEVQGVTSKTEFRKIG